VRSYAEDGSFRAFMDRHAEVTTAAARRHATAYEWASDVVRQAEEEEDKRKGDRG
jgi:hypothetical protein